MNSSEVWAAEEQTGATRWEVPVFDRGQDPNRPSLHTAQQIENIEAAAYQEGLARGHGEGYAAGLREAQQQAARLRALIEHMVKPLQHLDEQTEQTLVAVAVEAARRLVRAELDLDPDKVLAVAREALAALPVHARDVRLHVHADDARLLQEHLSPPPEAHHFRVIPDKDIARGDCRVQTEAAQVDARLDTRAATLKQALLGESA